MSILYVFKTICLCNLLSATCWYWVLSWSLSLVSSLTLIWMSSMCFSKSSSMACNSSLSRSARISSVSVPSPCTQTVSGIKQTYYINALKHCLFASVCVHNILLLQASYLALRDSCFWMGWWYLPHPVSFCISLPHVCSGLFLPPNSLQRHPVEMESALCHTSHAEHACAPIPKSFLYLKQTQRLTMWGMQEQTWYCVLYYNPSSYCQPSDWCSLGVYNLMSIMSSVHFILFLNIFKIKE